MHLKGAHCCERKKKADKNGRRRKTAEIQPNRGTSPKEMDGDEQAGAERGGIGTLGQIMGRQSLLDRRDTGCHLLIKP